MTEGVDGSDKVSGSDKEVSEVIYFGSFTTLGLPGENVLIIQCGSLCDEVGEGD